MKKISLYQAANKWVTSESVTISVQELKDYSSKREEPSVFSIKKSSSRSASKKKK